MFGHEARRLISVSFYIRVSWSRKISFGIVWSYPPSLPSILAQEKSPGNSLSLAPTDVHGVRTFTPETLLLQYSFLTTLDSVCCLCLFFKLEHTSWPTHVPRSYEVETFLCVHPVNDEIRPVCYVWKRKFELEWISSSRWRITSTCSL